MAYRASVLIPGLLLSLFILPATAQAQPYFSKSSPANELDDFSQCNPQTSSRPQEPDNPGKPEPQLQTSEEWNRRLKELLDAHSSASGAQDYLIGDFDVLDINVFEAQELNREVRVSAGGEISLPLLGAVRVAGLTSRELEIVLQELLRRTYMKDPHVSVFVREVQSHPVSILGAVRKPGVFQVRGSKSLLEILSLAEGLADDAGETVIIMKGAALQNPADSGGEKKDLLNEPSRPGPNVPDLNSLPANQTDVPSENTVQVNLRNLLDSSDPRQNPMVDPGDIVKVTRAGVVYVVGEVQKPGGFVMKSNERMSILQILALSGGLTHTAAKGGARIIRTNEQSGERSETPINLGKILAGKAPDPVLEPRDIVFVPNSAAKTALSRGAEGAAQTLTGLLVFHW